MPTTAPTRRRAPRDVTYAYGYAILVNGAGPDLGSRALTRLADAAQVAVAALRALPAGQHASVAVYDRFSPDLDVYGRYNRMAAAYTRLASGTIITTRGPQHA